MFKILVGVLLLLTITEIVTSVKDHLENKGYIVSQFEKKYGIGIELLATKGKDTFSIEAIGEASNKNDKNIIFAIGNIVKKMKQQGFWIHYGIAIPKNYYNLLKDFEIEGIKMLTLHIFLVENFYSLIHLEPNQTIELIQLLKAGNIVRLTPWGIENGLTE